MKTAISIPDNVYDAAEQLANRLGQSRSELYSKAVSIYIKKHQNVKVTEQLNDIYSCEDSNSARSLDNTELSGSNILDISSIARFDYYRN